jgi:hypothetical protein
MVSMPVDPDADLLDNLVATKRAYYVRGCSVGHLINDIEPGEFRSRLISHLAEPVHVAGHAAIARAIKQTLDVDVKALAIHRHRHRVCTCPDEVWQ